MNDLTQFFPHCTLKTENIREVIRNIIGMTENDAENHYFCYKCFKYIGTNSPKGVCCKKCFQFYCKNCAIPLSTDRIGRDIDSKKCIQCIENVKEMVYLI